MTHYRRYYVPGSSWFFTVNLAERRNNRLLVDHIDSLRAAFAYVKKRKPFRLQAVVVMPDHLHCIWRRPTDDADFSSRWGLLKSHFPRSLPVATNVRKCYHRGHRGASLHREGPSSSLFFPVFSVSSVVKIVFCSQRIQAQAR